MERRRGMWTDLMYGNGFEIVWMGLLVLKLRFKM